MPPLPLACGPSSGQSGTAPQPSSCPGWRDSPCLSCLPTGQGGRRMPAHQTPHVASCQSRSPCCSLLQQDEGGDPSSRWTREVISGPGAEAEGGAGSGKPRTDAGRRPSTGPWETLSPTPSALSSSSSVKAFTPPSFKGQTPLPFSPTLSPDNSDPLGRLV